MKSTQRLSRVLRGLAVTVLVAGLATWFATGTHVGWTQTSAVQMQRDEITGIDYPVRRDAFIAGVEVPVLAAVAAAALAGLSLLPRRTLQRA